MIPAWAVRYLPHALLAAALAGACWLLWDAGRDSETQKRDLQQVTAERNALVEQVNNYELALKEVNRMARQREEAKVHIQTVTKEIVREVPVRIPADACPLPADWRVLHDAAAQGTPPPPASAASGPDGGPVAPADAAETVAENYGQYHDIADRLRRLQQYVREILNAQH